MKHLKQCLACGGHSELVGCFDDDYFLLFGSHIAWGQKIGDTQFGGVDDKLTFVMLLTRGNGLRYSLSQVTLGPFNGVI